MQEACLSWLYDSEVAEIKSGLTDDDDVVSTWSNNLYDGASVRLYDDVYGADANADAEGAVDAPPADAASGMDESGADAEAAPELKPDMPTESGTDTEAATTATAQTEEAAETAPAETMTEVAAAQPESQEESQAAPAETAETESLASENAAE